jgi:hypothetical protein
LAAGLMGHPLGQQRDKQALPKNRERAKPKGAAKKRGSR